jgi:hypothetical protein
VPSSGLDWLRKNVLSSVTPPECLTARSPSPLWLLTGPADITDIISSGWMDDPPHATGQVYTKLVPELASILYSSFSPTPSHPQTGWTA